MRNFEADTHGRTYKRNFQTASIVYIFGQYSD